MMCPVVLYWRVAAVRNETAGFLREWRAPLFRFAVALSLIVTPALFTGILYLRIAGLLAGYTVAMTGAISLANHNLSD